MFFLVPVVFAVEPRYKAIPSIGWSLDRVVDLTSAGTVSGTTVAATDLDCTAAEFTNGGAVTTTAAGEFVCSDDDSGSGAPAGSGSEVQYRVNGSTFGAVTSSSVSGGNITLAGDLALSGVAGPDLSFTPTGGDTFHIGAESGASGGVAFIANTTDAFHYLRFTGGSKIQIPGLTNCDTLDTTADGTLKCGTDTAGAGGGDPVLIDGVSVDDASGVDLQGGAGIDITFNAGASPDTAAFITDNTELSSTTFGAGAFTTMTFDAGATDPVVTAGSGTLTIAPGGGDLTISDDVVLQDASPALTLDPTSGDSFGFHVDPTTSIAFINNETDGTVHIAFRGDTVMEFPQYPNCDIRTLGGGKVVCGANTWATNYTLQPYSAKLSGTYVTATITNLDAAAETATISGGSGPWKVLFAAATDQAAVWSWMLPDDWVSHGTLVVHYALASATTLEVEWEAAIQCTTPGDAEDIDTASFAAGATAGGNTVPGTAGFTDSSAITLTDDGCSPGDLIYFYVSTDADDAVNDDATGDRELLAVEYNYTRL